MSLIRRIKVRTIPAQKCPSSPPAWMTEILLSTTSLAKNRTFIQVTSFLLIRTSRPLMRHNNMRATILTSVRLKDELRVHLLTCGMSARDATMYSANSAFPSIFQKFTQSTRIITNYIHSQSTSFSFQSCCFYFQSCVRISSIFNRYL